MTGLDVGGQAAPLLVSEREAAKMLGLCTKTLYSLRQAGKLPTVRVGQRVLYDPADLRAFIQRQKVTGGAA
ncbi:MAG: helix-turn-helix domain-containing protein [Phycisphaeraceae bacterium]|nr:helix-turn-helix domain-containing protein [Phycisphaeraceae bacterium]